MAIFETLALIVAPIAVGAARPGRAAAANFLQQSSRDEPAEALEAGTLDDKILLPAYCCTDDLVLPGKKELIVIVSATRGSNLSFLQEQPYETHIVSDRTAAGTQRFRGYEAGAYIRYILSHYDSLPEKMVFLHGHRSSWEIGDEAKLLANIDRNAYDYMGLSRVWGVDLDDHHAPLVRDFIKNVVQNATLVQALPGPEGRFEYSFGSGGAFLVSADRIRHQSREAWQRISDWLNESGDDKEAGRFLEFSWHMLLGEKPEMLPPQPSKLCPQHPEACSHEPYVSGVPEWRLKWYHDQMQL